MVDFQNLFELNSIGQVNGETWTFTYEDDSGIYDFLYHNIGPHISLEGRTAYQTAGLCTDIMDESLCPAYFRSQFVSVFEVLQSVSKRLTSKIPSKLRCVCLTGNCKNCVCVKANRKCNRWCHGKDDNKDCSVQCLNSDVNKIVAAIKVAEDRGIWESPIRKKKPVQNL